MSAPLIRPAVSFTGILDKSTSAESSKSSNSTLRRGSIMELLYLVRRRSSKPQPQLYDVDDLMSELEDDSELSREKILSKIREKKEVIDRLRCQPWSMRRKVRTLRLSQKYLQRHEAKVSKTGLWRTEFMHRWKKFKRWCHNLSIYLIPWEARIKKIESHFGTVVSSYFTFLRWIFWVNLVITVILTCFIVVPELLAYGDFKTNRELGAGAGTNVSKNLENRKCVPAEERSYASTIQLIWQFRGIVEYSPMFYGYYSDIESAKIGKLYYRIPLAYFLIYGLILAYSFWAILRKMASNARLSKVASGKSDQYHFSWKVLVGWDYTIGSYDAATATIASNANKIREAMMEYKAQQKSGRRYVRWIARAIANILILGLVALSTYVVYYVVQESDKVQQNPHASPFERNQVAITVSFITLFFPNIFELIGKLERFHPRIALRLQLGRVLLLYLLNFYTLLFALFRKIQEMKVKEDRLDDILTASMSALRQDLEDIVVGRETRSLSSIKIPLSWLYNYIHSNYAVFCQSVATHYDEIIGTICSKNLTAITALSFSPHALPTEGGLLRVVRELTGPAAEHIDRANATLYDNVTFYRLGLTGDMEFIPPTGFPPDSGFVTPAPFTPDGHVAAAQPQTAYGRHSRLTCWENYMGQEICRLITMDLVMTMAAIFVIDFLRGLVVRYCNRFWCWNLETSFPEYGEFKVAENVLQIINNQGMIWLGLFFSPLIPALNTVKLMLLMYIRSWAVISCNVPAQEVFRASRSNNFYLLLVLLMLLLCTLPVGYVIASIKPSGFCGPFAKKERFYFIITHSLRKKLDQINPKIFEALEYTASPGVVIPILLLLILIIYFLVSLCRALKETNEDLKKQLQQERTEEKKKIYALAGGGHTKAENHEEHAEKPTPSPVANRARFNAMNHQPHGAGGRTLPVSISEDSSFSTDEDDDRSPLVHEQNANRLQARMPSSSIGSFRPSLNSLAEEAIDIPADGISPVASRFVGQTSISLKSASNSRDSLRNTEAPADHTAFSPADARHAIENEINFSKEDLKKMISPSTDGEESTSTENRKSRPRKETVIWMPADDSDPLMGFSEPETTGTDSELDVFTSERAGLPMIRENIIPGVSSAGVSSAPSSESSVRKTFDPCPIPALVPWPEVPSDYAKKNLRRVSDERNSRPPRRGSHPRSASQNPPQDEIEWEEGPPIILPKFRITSSRESTPSSPSLIIHRVVNATRRSKSAGPERRNRVPSSSPLSSRSGAVGKPLIDLQKRKASFASLSRETAI